MTSWSEGYVSDVAYSIGYYREMAPDHLAFAALAIGKDAGHAVKPTRVLELGIGMGVGFVIGAASQPDTFFEGCDFNPEHIVHTKRLADAAGLTNISIREASFQDLAAEALEGQHDLDIIQLHGILTWVSADAHKAIVEIARKRLKPGGLLYVSYNSMPGWASMMPVQRLMREHAKRQSGTSLEKTGAAIEAVKSLVAAKGGFFTSNPTVSTRIEKLAAMSPSYLAHEYLNENWFIFHFAEVAAMMEPAKLTFLASATMAENIDSVAVPVDMRSVVAAASDRVWKETLRDFASNKQFRRDIFARGTTTLNNLELLALLHTTRFTLSMPRSSVSLKINGPLGELDGRPDIYGPIADLLTDRIVDFGEIATSPALQPIGVSGTLQALCLMIHANQVLPIVGEPNSDVSTAPRLNRVLVDHATRGRGYNFLAAPVARSALSASNIDLLSLSAIFAGMENDPQALAQHVLDTMQVLGSKPVKEGKPVDDPDAMREVIETETKKFLAEKLPLFRRLGCL